MLGDAYEYLMRHFATESGKSKGQFYTPAEVSRIMAKVIGIGSATRADQTIHDPTCGSGSLLLKAHDEAEDRTGLDLTIYGQEMDNATAALAKMNMILHDCPTAEIWQDNSLSSPYFKQADGALKTFDFVVANPPFSTKAWSNGFNPAEDDYERFALRHPARQERRLCVPAAHPGRRSRAPARARSSCRTASCSGAMPRRTSARPSSAGATSRASSACPPTSSTAPASRPASWCWTRRTPPPAKASS